MDKSYPSSHDVERAVIGVMINFPEETIGMVARSGGADLFNATSCSVIYQALYYLHEHGEPVEYLTLLDRLTKDNTLDAAGGEATTHGIRGQERWDAHRTDQGVGCDNKWYLFDNRCLQRPQFDNT